MKNTLKWAAATAALAMSGTAIAGSGDGKIQIKALATLVAPDGKITSIELDNIGLPAGTQTKADDNFVPTIAAEYFFTPNISLETICCVTQHDVTGTGTLDGAGLVSNDKVGFALQAGFDLPINDKGLGLSVDAKRYFVNTTARWFAGDTEVLRTRHRIDPWVVSAGLAYRF